MESHSTPGEIQMTRTTYELLKDEFVCRRRGTILVKGMGRMETWYLVGSRSDAARAEPGIHSEAREQSNS
jgi:class 3 adenylate cyclase